MFGPHVTDCVRSFETVNQVGSLTGVVHLSNVNAGVLRRAQEGQKPPVEQKGNRSLDQPLIQAFGGSGPTNLPPPRSLGQYQGHRVHTSTPTEVQGRMSVAPVQGGLGWPTHWQRLLQWRLCGAGQVRPWAEVILRCRETQWPPSQLVSGLNL